MKHKLLYLLVLAALILSACGGAPASGTDTAQPMRQPAVRQLSMLAGLAALIRLIQAWRS